GEERSEDPHRPGEYRSAHRGSTSSQSELRRTAGRQEGTLFLVEGEAVRAPRRGPPISTVHKFDLSKRKAEKLLDGVRRFVVSDNGGEMLYQLGDKWFLTATRGTAKPGEGAGPPKSGDGPGPTKPAEGAVKLEDVEISIDPRAEWRQIYRETWRIERDFLYDP